MFERIVVPLDGSPLAESALPHSVAMARAFNSQVTLLRLLESEISENRVSDPLFWRMYKAEAEAYLQSVVNRLEKVGVGAGYQIREGYAPEQVIRYVEENQTDLIVLSSHGQGGLSRWNIGSVAFKILAQSYVSALVVRAYRKVPEALDELHYRKLLVPVDCSQRAECPLPVAVNLAQAQQATLILAHIIQRPEMVRRTPPTPEDLELTRRVVERNQQVADQYLADLKGRIPVPVETRLVVGNLVPKTLHELIEKEEIDLVMFCAHGSSGQTNWPYGGLVQNFIAYGTTPMLIFQDLPRSKVEETLAERAAKEFGRR